jgi:hypothetical protein
MSNKQMTAVELLQLEIDNKDMGEIPMWIYQFIEQAKEMEKQQIIDAWENGYEHGACVNEDEAKYHGIQYYNETYEQ